MAQAPSRPRQTDHATASQRLEVLLGHLRPFTGRPPVHALASWRVTDDWPDPVPVTAAEVALYEHWFADLLDEIALQGE